MVRGIKIYWLIGKNGGKDIHSYNDLPMTFVAAPVRAKPYYFREGINWSSVTAAAFSVPICHRPGSIFGTGGSLGILSAANTSLLHACLYELNVSVTNSYRFS